jgi:hypothetical protein
VLAHNLRVLFFVARKKEFESSSIFFSDLFSRRPGHNARAGKSRDIALCSTRRLAALVGVNVRLLAHGDPHLRDWREI